MSLQHTSKDTGKGIPTQGTACSKAKESDRWLLHEPQEVQKGWSCEVKGSPRC